MRKEIMTVDEGLQQISVSELARDIEATIKDLRLMDKEFGRIIKESKSGVSSKLQAECRKMNGHLSNDLRALQMDISLLESIIFKYFAVTDTITDDRHYDGDYKGLLKGNGLDYLIKEIG